VPVDPAAPEVPHEEEHAPPGSTLSTTQDPTALVQDDEVHELVHDATVALAPVMHEQ
jgi:hypothetical protein